MKFFLAAAFVAFAANAFAQTESDTVVMESQVFTFVEQMPEFPGGQTALLNFLQTNIEYPDSARLADVEGRVFVRFVVNENGEVTKPEIARGVHPWLDAEALRVAQMMPRWKPGKQNGRSVSTFFTLPITFALE